MGDGGHRLYCGDCTSQADVAALLGDAKIDLVFTDPPYNVAYSGLGQNRLGTIENDDQTTEAFSEWLGAVFKSMAGSMRDQACIYICHPDSASAPKLAFETAFAASFKKSSTIIWIKQSAGMGWQDYRAQHEPVLYGWKESKKGRHYYSGDRAKTTVWQLNRDSQIAYVHPTQKPIELAEEAIYNSSKVGWNVADFFAGSGSTLIGCQRSGRKCFSLEIDPRFCDVIIERWQTFSGEVATLDGIPFNEIAAMRAKSAPKAKRGASGVRRGALRRAPAQSR